MRAFRCQDCGTLNRVPDGESRSPNCGRCKTKVATSGEPQAVTQVEMERTVASAPVPVLVDFWAPWCGPCRMAAPILERIGKKHAGRILVLKVNTEEERAVSGAYGVSGIPTFILFSEGKEASRQVGLLPEQALERWATSS